jgi:hypothetical protein
MYLFHRRMNKGFSTVFFLFLRQPQKRRDILQRGFLAGNESLFLLGRNHLVLLDAPGASA